MYVGLQKIYPGLAKSMESIPPVSFSPNMDELVLFGQNEIQTQWHPDVELHIVWRFASGCFTHELFNKINLEEFYQSKNRRLLLIEDRPAVFRSALETLDWTTLIQSEICLFAVDLPTRNILDSLLRMHPHIAFASFQVYAGDPSCSKEEMDQIVKTLELYKQFIQGFLDSALEKQKQIPASPFPANLHFFVPGHNIFQDACVQSFRQIGYNAMRLKWKSPPYRFIRSSAWAQEMRMNYLQTIFFLNTTPKKICPSRHLADLQAKKIVWFVDNPARYAPAPGDYAGCDVIGVFDETYIPYLKDRSKAEILPVHTGYGIDSSMIREEKDFSGIAIAFVGELGTRGFLPVEIALNQYNPRIVTITTDILMNLDIRHPIHLTPLVEQIYASQGVSYSGALVEYLENKATTLRRRYYLDALQDKGLVLFGYDEWSEKFAGDLRICYAGRTIDYNSELPSLYASAKININIYHVQCVHAPNPRVYDVLACGGFFINHV